jgi:hypothetical protein
MTRIRSKRQRPLGFEALEGRLALSAGMGMAAASHRAALLVMSQAQTTIPASFKGHVQIVNGSILVITNLSGTIGKNHLTGFATGTVVGTQFQGGDVYLSNGPGNVHLKLGPAFVVNVGKSSKQEVSVIAVSASGKYAKYAGITGFLTTWSIPANPKAFATVAGFFNV